MAPTAKPIVKGHATRIPIVRPPMIIAKMVFVIVFTMVASTTATEETWIDRSVPARRAKEIVIASTSATPDMSAKS